VVLISVPRDLYVYIPNRGMDRINAAYEYGEMDNYPGGGFALLKDTILYNLGLSIDHLAIVDFDGFRRIVDTLGGIDVPVFCSYTDWHLIDPSYDQNDENNWALYTVGPGVVHMDGDLALWYARSRKKSSDFDRGRRSQEVLRALYARALQTDTISKIPELYSDFSSSFITDLTLPDLLQLAPLAGHLNNADIRSYYIGRDLVTGWMTPGGASVLLPNGPAIQSMLQQALSFAPRTTDAEALAVEVRNGTVNPGWDSLAAERLNYVGYNTRLAFADRQDYANSLLYDLSDTPDLSRAGSLLNVLGLPPAAFVTAPMQVDINYVLIVGADYQPCFNPATIAP
jgi:LCP family protein required for cell wall assembly